MNNKLAILDAESIVKIVENSVEKALKESLPSIIRRANLPEYLTTSELSRLASWSEGKIFYMRKEKRIKFIQEGRSVVYPTDWILDYLERHKITPRKDVLKELSSQENL